MFEFMRGVVDARGCAVVAADAGERSWRGRRWSCDGVVGAFRSRWGGISLSAAAAVLAWRVDVQ